MVRRQLLGAALACLTAAACSASASVTPSPIPGTAGPPVATSPSAVAAADFVAGGDRPVTVHVPASYDASQPAPLLLLLHGYSSRGSEIDGYFGLAGPAAAHGYVYATPDGTTDDQGNRFWNATDACCNFDRSSVDDVAYLSGLITEIQGRLAIDPKRIAVVGHSNGAFMAYRMACERADLLAAIVSLAGATFVDPADCTPSAPLSVAQIHGTADDTIRFDGGGPVSSVTRAYPSAEKTVETWATYDGCGATPSALASRIDVDANLSAGSDAAETSVEAWSGCDAGAAVQLWTIPGGGHVPALTPAFADAVVAFLAGHPKP